jgi:monovalent cation/hydrogen antiporter
MLLFAAFTVTLGTLLIQGLTLRRLVLVLHVRDDAFVDREVREARIAMADAALAALSDEKEGEADVLRAELDAERRLATTTGKDEARLAFPAKTLRMKALAVRREHLLAMRGEGVIGDEAFHRLEEELDFLDLALATQTHN